jgi:hypothetical protein
MVFVKEQLILLSNHWRRRKNINSNIKGDFTQGHFLYWRWIWRITTINWWPTCNAVTIKDSAIQNYQKDFLILEDYIIQIFFLFLLAKKYIPNQKLQMRSSIKTLNLNYCFFKFILKEISTDDDKVLIPYTQIKK